MRPIQHGLHSNRQQEDTIWQTKCQPKRFGDYACEQTKNLAKKLSFCETGQPQHVVIMGLHDFLWFKPLQSLKMSNHAFKNYVRDLAKISYIHVCVVESCQALLDRECRLCLLLNCMDADRVHVEKLLQGKE